MSETHEKSEQVTDLRELLEDFRHKLTAEQKDQLQKAFQLALLISSHSNDMEHGFDDCFTPRGRVVLQEYGTTDLVLLDGMIQGGGGFLLGMIKGTDPV